MPQILFRLVCRLRSDSDSDYLIDCRYCLMFSLPLRLKIEMQVTLSIEAVAVRCLNCLWLVMKATPMVKYYYYFWISESLRL